MKIRADRKSLAETITWVAQAIPKGPAAPALAGIRLRAEGDVLVVSAFDYDVSHEARTSAEVASEGECLVSGAFLRTIITALPGEHVEMVLDNGALTISTGRSTYRARTMRMDDYPNLPETPTAVGTVTADDLAAAVAACSPPVDDAAPSESVRGMRIEASTELEVVGLTGALMIRHALDWSGGEFAATVPGQAIGAAVKGLAGEVTIGQSESGVSLSDAERTVVMRTLAGKFADWRRVRTASTERFVVTADRDELTEAVKRAGLLTRNGRDVGPVSLAIEPETIEVTATDETSGGSEVVTATTEGRELILFSPLLLADALAAVPPGAVRLGIGKRRSPDMGGFMTIQPAENAGDREAVVAARKGGEAR